MSAKADKSPAYAEQFNARFVMDAAGNIADWDAGSQKLFGWTQDEAIGKRVSALIIPERFRAMHEAGMASFRQTGKGAFLGKTIRIDALHRDGHEFSIEIAIDIERGPSGDSFPTRARVAPLK